MTIKENVKEYILGYEAIGFPPKRKLYKTGGWKELIEIVYPTKASKTSVWIHCKYKKKVERKKRFSNHGQYWNELKDAKEYLKGLLDERIKDSELNIDKLKVRLDELKEFEPSVSIWGFLVNRCPIKVKCEDIETVSYSGKKKKRGRPRKNK